MAVFSTKLFSFPSWVRVRAISQWLSSLPSSSVSLLGSVSELSGRGCLLYQALQFPFLGPCQSYQAEAVFSTKLFSFPSWVRVRAIRQRLSSLPSSSVSLLGSVSELSDRGCLLYQALQFPFLGPCQSHQPVAVFSTKLFSFPSWVHVRAIRQRLSSLPSSSVSLLGSVSEPSASGCLLYQALQFPFLGPCQSYQTEAVFSTKLFSFPSWVRVRAIRQRLSSLPSSSVSLLGSVTEPSASGCLLYQALQFPFLGPCQSYQTEAVFSTKLFSFPSWVHVRAISQWLSSLPSSSVSLLGSVSELSASGCLLYQALQFPFLGPCQSHQPVAVFSTKLFSFPSWVRVRAISQWLSSLPSSSVSLLGSVSEPSASGCLLYQALQFPFLGPCQSYQAEAVFSTKLFSFPSWVRVRAIRQRLSSLPSSSVSLLGSVSELSDRGCLLYQALQFPFLGPCQSYQAEAVFSTKLFSFHLIKCSIDVSS